MQANARWEARARRRGDLCQCRRLEFQPPAGRLRLDMFGVSVFAQKFVIGRRIEAVLVFVKKDLPVAIRVERESNQVVAADGFGASELDAGDKLAGGAANRDAADRALERGRGDGGENGGDHDGEQ